MSKKIKTEAAKRLFQAVLTLETEEECFTFFEDLCTVNELESLAQRFEVASMLYDKHTYLEVADKTGASTATISRVNRSCTQIVPNTYKTKIIYIKDYIGTPSKSSSIIC